MIVPASTYRGRFAPSPTGFLHLGHAATFWTAQARADALGGTMILRVENLDRARCKPEFVAALLEDLSWIGLKWSEGPDAGGAFEPYVQMERMALYMAAWRRLAAAGNIYPCVCTRRDTAHGALRPPPWGACLDQPGSLPAPGLSSLPRRSIPGRELALSGAVR